MPRPTLIVGDVQGDYERLLEALAPYPEAEVETIFLGDFFQGGRLGAAGGAAAARIARSRKHSQYVLGNHDLFLLAMLEYLRIGKPARVPWGKRSGKWFEETWVSRRGDWADVDAVARDPDLESWLRSLPFMVTLSDGTLVQHSDTDAYARLGSSVEEVNSKVR
ncbi:MAG TPA: metallophosphoesterase, partial [Candidatus Sulfotelmatobacter sp.]|nr:metallophosphoesterase [Candidatus Sulfotelmatobacter sp.]